MSETLREVFLVNADGTLKNIGGGHYKDCIRLAFRKARNIRRCSPEPIPGPVDDELHLWHVDGGLCIALEKSSGKFEGRVLVMNRNSPDLSYPFSIKLPQMEEARMPEFEVVSTRGEETALFRDTMDMCKRFAEQEVYRIKSSAPAYEGLRRRKTKFWHRTSDGALLCGFRQKGYDYPTAFFAIRPCRDFLQMEQEIIGQAKGVEQ